MSNLVFNFIEIANDIQSDVGWHPGLKQLHDILQASNRKGDANMAAEALKAIDLLIHIYSGAEICGDKARQQSLSMLRKAQEGRRQFSRL